MENNEDSEFSNLQYNFVKQQAQISALKELVRKTEISNEKTTYTQEKVKNIAQRLTHIKSKVRTRQNHDLSFSAAPVEEDKVHSECSTNSASEIKVISDKPGSEKFYLLRQKMSQNKLKMAERENTKKEIEEMVFQLKAKIDSTQLSLDKSSELGRSMTELSTFSGTPVTKFKSSADLNFIPLNIDKERIKFLENRVKFLDKQIGNEKELNNKCQCKNQIKLTESEAQVLEKSLREKERITPAHARDDKNNENLVRNEILLYQNDVSQIEDNHLQQMDKLKSEILNLKEINNILEQTRFDLTVKNSKMELEIQDIHSSYKKIEELNKSLQNQVISLMNQKEEIYSKENILQNNKDEINLELKQQKEPNQISKHQEYEDKLIEKDIEYNVLKANFLVLEEKIKSSPKNLFSKITDKAGETEINKLKQQLDDSNKSMIKLKLKAKQLQKQIDRFGKISNVNNELILLLGENQKLQQKNSDIETENHQLRLNYDDGSNIIKGHIDLSEKTGDNKSSVIHAFQDRNLETDDRLHQLQDVKKKLYNLQNNLIEIIGDKTLIPDFEKITLEELILNFTTNIETLKCSYNNCKLQLKDLLHHCDPKNIFNQEYGSYSEIQDNDLSASLVKLTEESSELMYKIEIFAIERREVLDKMEALSNENKENIMKIALLEQEKIYLQGNVAELRYENSNLGNNMHKISADNVKLKKEIVDVRNHSDNITMNTQSISNIPSNSLTQSFIKKCANQLDTLYIEIKNFKKNDKSIDLQASTKLVKLVEVAISELKNLIECNKNECQYSEKAAELGYGAHEHVQRTEIQNENCVPSNTLNTQIKILEKSNENLEALNNELKEQLSKLFNEKNLTENYNLQLTTELSNMQQTVDTLNSQIMDLYETIEKNTANLLEKDDDIIRQREILDIKISEINTLRNENKALYEKHLSYESELLCKINDLEKHNALLEMKTIKQLDKLKKFAANIKKKSADCNNLEEKIKFLEEKHNSDQKLLEGNDDLKNQIIFYKNEIENLNLSKTHVIQNIMDAKDLLENNLTAIKMELDKKNQELEYSQLNYESIKNEVVFLKNKNSIELQQQIATQNENIEENKNFIQSLLNELKLKNIEMEKLQIQDKEKTNEIVKFKFDNTNLKILNNSNSEIINESVRKFNEVQKNYTQLLYKYDKELESFHNKIFKIETLYELLAAKLSEYINSIEMLESEHKSYKDIILELENSVLSFEKCANISFTQLQSKGIASDMKRGSLINRLQNLLNYSGLNKFLDTQDENLNKTAKMSHLGQQHSIIKFDETEQLKDLLNVSYLEQIPNEKERDKTWLDVQNSSWKPFKQQESKVSDGISLDISPQNNETEVNAYQIQISDPDLMRTKVKQNQTDDQALIENENKILKDILNKKDSDIEMYQRTILQLQSSIVVPSKSTPEITNLKSVDIQEKYDILTKEIIELKTVLNKKNKEINSLQIELKQLYENPSISSRENSLNEDIISYRPVDLFTDIPKVQSINDKDKIEDLQRNVCDLEKYVANLENKIINLIKTSNEAPLQMLDKTYDTNLILPKYEEHRNTLEGKLEAPLPKTNETLDPTSKYLITDSVTSNENGIDVVEAVIVPKKAYLCGPDTSIESSCYDDNMLKAEQTQNIPVTNEAALSMTALYEFEKKRVQDFVIRVEELELEQQRLHEEKQALQIKSGKMMKKLKEYKLKAEQQNQFMYTTKSNKLCSSVVDLDLTIQEEMKNEIIRLEKKTEEYMKNLENEKNENTNLLKRINTLVTTNERMAEIKEYQDIEINNMQRHIHDLNLKITPPVHCERQDEINYQRDISCEKGGIGFNREMHLKSIIEELQSTLDKEISSKSFLEKHLKSLQEKNLGKHKYSSEEKDYFQFQTDTLDIKIESDFKNTIEQLKKDSVNIMNMFYSLREEFQKNLNENLKLNNDLQFYTRTNNVVKDVQLNFGVQNTAFSNQLNFSEQQNTDNEIINSNDVTFLVNEINRKWNKKIRDFAEIWKANILENESISQSNINLMQNKLDELQSTQNTDSSLNSQLELIKTEEEKTDIIRNMKKALEDQELEIITLKDQLAVRSAQRDPYAQISYTIESLPLAQNYNVTNKNSELDSTLYMLHQKDMRCEELQLELINLLEERDILQLKLSNAIRQNEDFKHKFVKFCEDKRFLHDKCNEAENSSSVSLEDQKYDVSTKVSRMYTVNDYTKDYNRERELETMQQGFSIDTTEVVGEPIGVGISNANSMQSGSTLLNWLWGKSSSS